MKNLFPFPTYVRIAIPLIDFQFFDQAEANTGSSLADPFQSYDGSSSYSGIDDSSSAPQINPYAQDASGGAGAAFYQHPNAYTHPVQCPR